MDKKCEKCGSTNIKHGKLLASGGVVFIPDDSKGHIIKKASPVVSYACLDCGCIFGFELECPEKIK